ncbi:MULTISPECIES: phosphotriesterase family protein [Bhargavaea]|uniref:Phosphotriesterase n=1 Tax=Bhargavaea changchunensis TaxID=2134037 RepID=A0ABW2NH34_9BACL|nr:hypothetical protein [Bhargavaea sp. CC-171006]
MTQEKVLETVRGAISPSEIGLCHSHEHLFIKKGQPEKLDPALLLDDYEKTKSEVELFKRLGGRTIVDAQPVGSGRDAKNLLKLSEESGVHVLASTGFHKFGFYPDRHWIHERPVRDLADLFISEINEGLFADGEEAWPERRLPAKAGLIKTAADSEGPVGRYAELFQAAAIASVETGAPIMSHTELGEHAMDQVRCYIKHGVSEDRLILCHLDRRMENAEDMLRVADTGVYLELDTIGRFKYHSDQEEAELIRLLLDHGHEDRLLLGLDTTRKRMKSYGGEIGLDHLIGAFLPLLRETGITESQIEKMMTHNPARAYSKRIHRKELHHDPN